MNATRVFLTKCDWKGFMSARNPSQAVLLYCSSAFFARRSTIHHTKKSRSCPILKVEKGLYEAHKKPLTKNHSGYGNTHWRDLLSHFFRATAFCHCLPTLRHLQTLIPYSSDKEAELRIQLRKHQKKCGSSVAESPTLVCYVQPHHWYLYHGVDSKDRRR